MFEIFEIVSAINRLKDTVTELCSKIDFISKSPALKAPPKYLNEEAACDLLNISHRTLAKMRSDGSIPFIKSHRKILFLASDLYEYLEVQCKNAPPSPSP